MASLFNRPKDSATTSTDITTNHYFVQPWVGVKVCATWSADILFLVITSLHALPMINFHIVALVPG
jgi:hypothetical protein